MKNDFVGNAERFIEVNYETIQGDLRIEFLLHDLQELISSKRSIRRILDIGAGNAPVTLRLIRDNPGLTAHLTDPSKHLLDDAKRIATELGVLPSRFTTEIGSMDDVRAGVELGEYDLFICHVVANWVPDPYAFIKDLSLLLSKNDQYVSLAIGTTFGHEIKYADIGKLDLLKMSVFAPEGPMPSLTYGKDLAVKLLNPLHVKDYLEKNQFRVVTKAAVKVFSEYVQSGVFSDPQALSMLRDIEYKVRLNEYYWMLGNLAHFIYSLP